MRQKIQTAQEICSQGGLTGLFSEGIQFVFNQKIAPHTPRMYQLCNGVILRHNKMGKILSSAYDTGGFRRPTYEDGLKQGAEDMICSGDDVVILGAGAGVVTTYASRFAGEDGHVFAYEASVEMTRVLNGTIDRNRTIAPISVNHAAVGKVRNAWGELGEPDKKSVNSLPSADVFVIDIEGAEVEVLESLPTCRGVVVESHGVLDASTDDIKQILYKNGFEINSVMMAEPSRPDICEKNDIRVVVASQEDHET